MRVVASIAPITRAANTPHRRESRWATFSSAFHGWVPAARRSADAAIVSQTATAARRGPTPPPHENTSERRTRRIVTAKLIARTAVSAESPAAFGPAAIASAIRGTYTSASGIASPKVAR